MKKGLGRVLALSFIVLTFSIFIVSGSSFAQTAPYASIAGGTFSYDAGTNQLTINMGVIGTLVNSNGNAFFTGPEPMGDYMFGGKWEISGLVNSDAAGENWQFVQDPNVGAQLTLKDGYGATRATAKLWDFTVDKTETSPGSGAFVYEVNAGYDETNVKDFVFASNSPFSRFIDDAQNMNAQPWEPMGNLYMKFNFTGVGTNDFTQTQSGTVSGTLSIVPEPVSSILFAVGSITLGLRRFVRRKFSRVS